MYYEALQEHDLSEAFLSAIQTEFQETEADALTPYSGITSREVVRSVMETYHIGNVNLIKPGIGEATRVLLRRVPWKIIVNADYQATPELHPIRQLAQEKNVPCEISAVPLGNYKVCGMIRKLSDI